MKCPHWHTTPRDPTEQAYRLDMRALVAGRVALVWTLLLLFLWTVCALGWFYFPERYGAILVLCALSLFIALANVRLVRALPDQTLLLTGLATTAWGLSFSAYCVRVHSLAELCVMGLMIFLTGLVVMFPWGWRGQGAVSAGLVLGYLLALKNGVVPALPGPYGVAMLSMAAVLTTLGAHLIDTYRFAAYRHALACERANTAKSEFLATVSHELRTPLTVIMGFTDLVIEGVLAQPAEQTDAVRRIRQHSQQLLDLVQSMLDLNRLESGGVQMRLESFRLADLIESLRENLPASWCKDGVRLAWELRDGTTVMHSDRSKVEMILRNLVHNALKYTEAGSVMVSVEAPVSPGHVKLSVADTGAGIDPVDLAKIFEMFQQADAQAPRDGGVGLGLFIVRRFSALLGGTVTVESQPGAGARFTVVLPIEAPSAPTPRQL